MEVKQTIKNIGAWAKKHPVIAVLILGGVIALAWWAASRASTSSEGDALDIGGNPSFGAGGMSGGGDAFSDLVDDGEGFDLGGDGGTIGDAVTSDDAAPSYSDFGGTSYPGYESSGLTSDYGGLGAFGSYGDLSGFADSFGDLSDASIPLSVGESLAYRGLDANSLGARVGSSPTLSGYSAGGGLATAGTTGLVGSGSQGVKDDRNMNIFTGDKKPRVPANKPVSKTFQSLTQSGLKSGREAIPASRVSRVAATPQRVMVSQAQQNFNSYMQSFIARLQGTSPASGLGVASGSGVKASRDMSIASSNRAPRTPARTTTRTTSPASALGSSSAGSAGQQAYMQSLINRLMGR